MSNYAPESTRRRLLQLFAGAPMLPLAGLTVLSGRLDARDPRPVADRAKAARVAAH